MWISYNQRIEIKSLVQRGRWFCAAVAVVGSSACAWEQAITDTSGYVTLTATDAGGTHSFAAAGHWSDGEAPSAGKKYLVNGGRTFRSPEVKNANVTFAGDSLTLDNAYMNVKGVGGSMTITNFQLYACRVAHGNANTERVLYGNYYLHGTNVFFSGSGNGGTRQFVMDGALHGNGDTVLNIIRTPGEVDGSPNNFFVVRMRGSNEEFAGRYVVTGSNICLAASTTTPEVLGTYSGPEPFVTLVDDGCLYGTGTFSRGGYTNCTIAIRGGGVVGRLFGSSWPTFDYGCVFSGDGESDLKIKNSSKAGYGGSTIFGACSFEGVNAVRVRRGAIRTLADFAEPELPIVFESESEAGVQYLAGYSEHIGPVSVTSGKFYVSPGVDGTGTLGVASLDLNENSHFEFDIKSDGGSDFLRVDGNVTKPAALEKFTIRCASSFMPSTDGFSVRLLSAANLGTDYTADDFEIVFTDSFVSNTVSGALSLVEENGTNVLVWTASKPIYCLTTSDGSGSSFNAAGGWSSGAAPTEGYDYVVPGGKVLRIRSAGTFAGSSLSIASGGDLAFNVRGGVVNDLRLFPGGKSTSRNSGSANGLRGTATVIAGEPAFKFTIETQKTQSSGRTCHLENTFKGDGDLCFEYTNITGSDINHDPSHGYPTYFYLSGSSPEFTGGMQLAHWAVRTVISDELALGGPTPEFRADRLLFASNAILRVESDVTLKEPTRGITVSDVGNVDSNAIQTCGGSLEVLEGATLTISNVIAGAGQLRKLGAGSLVLSGDSTFSGQFTINKGRVTATHPNALGTGVLAACADTVLRIETDEGIAKPSGFTVDATSGFVPAPVELAAFDSPASAVIEATIFRIADATEFDTSTISVLPGGLGSAYKIDVLTETTETGLRVYARACTRDLKIIVR